MTATARAAYTLTEAAELLGGISRQTLWRMEGRGDLRIVRIGRRALVPADEIQRIISPEVIPLPVTRSR